MGEAELFFKFLLTIAIGAILGLETETRSIEIQGKLKAQKEEVQKIGGLRTYTVLSLFGGVAGVFFLQGVNILVYILFLSIIAFTLVAYILNVQFKKAFGLTTEIAVIITFTLGFLTTSSLVPLPLVMVILVLLTFFLSQKRGIGAFINRIEHKEVIDIIKFGLVSLVILPVLPNQNFTIGQLVSSIDPTLSLSSSLKSVSLVNPFEIWLLVVLISGINLLGYVLSKVLGKSKGFFFAGVFGGLISSTSVVISLAIKSKKEKRDFDPNFLAGIAIIANSFSFFTVGTLMAITNKQLFIETLPFLLTMVNSGIIVGIFLMRKQQKDRKKLNEDLDIKYQPFSIGPALKFVLLILVIKLFVQFLQLQHVNSSFLVGVTALSGFTGMDAPTIAFGELVESGTLTLQMGVYAVILVNTINFLAKSIYSFYMGDRKYFSTFTLSLLIVGIIGIIAAVLI